MILGTNARSKGALQGTAQRSNWTGVYLELQLDLGSMRIWVGPSNWWIGVDLG